MCAHLVDVGKVKWHNLLKYCPFIISSPSKFFPPANARKHWKLLSLSLFISPLPSLSLSPPTPTLKLKPFGIHRDYSHVYSL